MSKEHSRASKLAIFADNIQKLREHQFPGHGGKKQCADSMGIQLQQWSPWELGQKIPRKGNIVKIARFFGVTTEELMTDTRGKTAEEAFPSLLNKSVAVPKVSPPPISHSDIGENFSVPMDKGVRSMTDKIKEHLKDSIHSQGFNGVIRFRFYVTGVDIVE